MGHLHFWSAAETACSRMTQPAVDPRTADRDVEALVRASRLWGALAAFGPRVRRAWTDSVTRRLLVAKATDRP